MASELINPSDIRFRKPWSYGMLNFCEIVYYVTFLQGRPVVCNGGRVQSFTIHTNT